MHADTVWKALLSVTSDEGFTVPSARAKEALDVGKQLVTWCGNKRNRRHFHAFSKWLVRALNRCVEGSSSRNWRLRMERTWGLYIELRTSKPFLSEWEKFFRTAVGSKALPTHFQYVSDVIFEELLKEEYKLTKTGDTGPAPLTFIEENALRYVAGYVCRSVHSKIKKNKAKSEAAVKFKERALDFIMSMCGDEEDEQRGTETWTNAIDRGGLWHVSDDVYMTFLTLEIEIRHYFNIYSLTELNNTMKRRILESTSKNEDLLFQWTIVSADADDSISTEVLRRISELYLTVRGFAFAKTVLEMYKQCNKKQVHKSRAQRKELATGTATATAAEATTSAEAD